MCVCVCVCVQQLLVSLKRDVQYDCVSVSECVCVCGVDNGPAWVYAAVGRCMNCVALWCEFVAVIGGVLRCVYVGCVIVSVVLSVCGDCARVCVGCVC